MLHGLWRLTWLEIKIFAREPLGLVGSVGMPVLVFLVVGRMLGPQAGRGGPQLASFATVGLPVLAALLIAVSAVLSLVTIVALYREGGILKRLRATPLRPGTILLAHVIVKLLFTALTLLALALAGRRLVPLNADDPWLSFSLAVLFTTFSILSMGFVIASLVPTARFAQPVAALVFYPMLGLSGLFRPIDALPPALQVVARAHPLTYAVSLLGGIWRGEGWGQHLGDVAALTAVFLLCVVVSSRVFRWE
jgi:ABC-2 type transport system permease protein